MPHHCVMKSTLLLIVRYMHLEVPDGKCQVMYVWIDGTGEYLRCKTKTMDFVPKCAEGSLIHLIQLMDPLLLFLVQPTYWHVS